MVGARARQGPHHTAQKSTRTGLSLLTTSCSQLSVVNSITLALAIGSAFHCWACFRSSLHPLYRPCKDGKETGPGRSGEPSRTGVPRDGVRRLKFLVPL